MAILVDHTTRVLIQGITGRSGTQVCEMLQKYNTKVIAGVRPGKGGEEVLGVPVYNSVQEAVSKHIDINASLIYVPPGFVLDATFEALEAGIPLLHIFTEKVPILDSAKIFAKAQEKNARVLGPASIGALSPGLGKIGSIGGFENRGFEKGEIGIVSKSGGMCSEIANILARAGFGQSTVVGIGGDMIACTNFVDLLELFEKDDQTKTVVLFGEVGGTYEEEAAEFIRQGKLSKPVVAYIAGRFINTLPQGTALGHAGAMIEGDKGTWESKVTSLKDAGVQVAQTLEDIPVLLKEELKQNE
ncbi:CoA-binding protein [Candidatus Microgenomates bacterium]|nr:CoA-binding protein [Candidatus Microgenomates bacterium]